MKILITGTAGFIGFHLSKFLLDRGDTVIGVDVINDYYDVNLKYDRLRQMGINPENLSYGSAVKSARYPNYIFYKTDLCDKEILERCFSEHTVDIVCNLAAQAGVRYSLTNPDVYVDSNIKGFLNILEACRRFQIRNLVYASSSSVYGLNKGFPFSEHKMADHPVSLYAASKKANEMMAHTYSHLFNIATTGLRFFTVYGPWGRPDMALFLFTKAMLEGRPIDVFNNGTMQRDFTYIDDIIRGIVYTLDNPSGPDQAWNSENPDPASSSCPYRILNIGRGAPVSLMDFIAEIEYQLGLQAIKNYLPLQPGDVSTTSADISSMSGHFNYQPQVSVKQGIYEFIKWYKSYYGAPVSTPHATVRQEVA